MQSLVVAPVVATFTSAVVPILVANISFEHVTIPKGKVIADDTVFKTPACRYARTVGFDELCSFNVDYRRMLSTVA